MTTRREWRGTCPACGTEIIIRSVEDWVLEFSLACPTDHCDRDVMLTSAGQVDQAVDDQMSHLGSEVKDFAHKLEKDG